DFNPEQFKVLADILDELPWSGSGEAADDLVIGPDLLAPIARNALLYAGVDHLHDVPAQQGQALSGSLVGALFGLNHLRQFGELLGSRDDRRQIEAVGLLDLSTPSLACKAFAVRAVPADDQPAIDQDGQ